MNKIERKNQVALIQLKGEPYQDEATGIDANLSLDRLAQNTNYAENLPEKIDQAMSSLYPLIEEGGYYSIDNKLKHGHDLSFDEAFSLITFVVSALNKPLLDLLAERIQNLGPLETHTLQAVALLANMSAKESYAQLTPDEIAGAVAATIHLDTVIRTFHSDEVLSFGGMGGDKGYPKNGHNSKLFSLSTLSSVALSSLYPIHKHHSYPNTSKVAGQSAIEAFGARSDFHSAGAFSGVLEEANLLMTSCHNTRTLHTLSHLLRGETINHIIGPLAFTLSKETPINGFIGVNEKVHPETIIDALQILKEKGYQQYENSAVYCGTDLLEPHPAMLDQQMYYASKQVKEHIRLDEIAPPPFVSLVAFAAQGESVGTFVLHPSDFYSERDLALINYESLLIPNTREDILHFNIEAISGRDESKARYLAMTIGLGIFVREYLGKKDALDLNKRRVNPNYLRQATARGLELLKSGQAEAQLNQYVLTTQKYAG